MKKKKVDQILKNAKVVNEDGTEHKTTTLERIDDWCFDNLWLYGFGYRIWKEYICPRVIKRMIKHFFQRRIRGFDDSETWNLDYTFFKWLAPRLKRFSEVTCAWPDQREYKSFEEWKVDLEKRADQCYKIINIDEFDFTDHSYITKETRTLIKKHKVTDESMINAFAKEDCIRDLINWYSEHLFDLWW